MHVMMCADPRQLVGTSRTSLSLSIVGCVSGSCGNRVHTVQGSDAGLTGPPGEVQHGLKVSQETNDRN